MSITDQFEQASKVNKPPSVDKGFGQHVGQRPKPKPQASKGIQLRSSVGAGLASSATNQLQKNEIAVNQAKQFVDTQNEVLADEIYDVVSGEFQARNLFEKLAEKCADVAPVEYPELDFSQALEAMQGLGKPRELPVSETGPISFLPPGVA